MPRSTRPGTFCTCFGSLGEAIIIGGNTEHRLLGRFVVHLIREGARFFCALPPMLRIVDEGCCHGVVGDADATCGKIGADDGSRVRLGPQPSFGRPEMAGKLDTRGWIDATRNGRAYAFFLRNETLWVRRNGQYKRILVRALIQSQGRAPWLGQSWERRKTG